MAETVSTELNRIGIFAILVNAHAYWTRLVNKIVPDPYLDEVFHIPQAQAYWAGHWSTWDPKITTPPGVYLFSSLFHGLYKPMTKSIEQTTTDLRGVNFWLLYALLIALHVFNRVTVSQPSPNEVLSKEWTIIAFPLLFFFSGLYYTDLFSAFTVVVTYICWMQGMRASEKRWKWQALHLVSGLVAIGTRQTNIFWVAVFLGGLQIRETAHRLAGKYRIFDPPMLGAYVEDFITMCVSVGFTAISDIPSLLLDLWPQLSLLASFAAFVYWNGGVVLGDKTNHIPSLHIPQMLYIWPFIAFFSWPVLLPHLFNLKILRRKLPRAWLSIVITILMTLAVYTNTIVHPFTLADNRHYIFYVFRLLLAHPAIKYAVVPVYLACAWLIITAFGGTSPSGDEFRAIPEGTVHVSFVLVWLIATSLSLVTAPLVEPRYFIIPWLLWRLHVPAPDMEGIVQVDPKGKQKAGTPVKPTQMSEVLSFIASHILWLELAWFTLINAVTGWMFLNWGFEWAQEPGRVQRFMW